MESMGITYGASRNVERMNARCSRRDEGGILALPAASVDHQSEVGSDVTH
jgi:hypothetical protein